jgi:[ribosomal protein S5]-alanine N-acetyltransferase
MPPYHYPEGQETGRLITRHLTEGDIPCWTAFFKEPEAIEFFPMYHNKPHEDSAREWIERQCTRYIKQEYGMQAVLEKKTGLLVGQCGLIAKDIDGIRELEVGYSILKPYWGLGYAAEAARLFMDFAFRDQRAGSIISTISPGNAKSIRVAEKNGLVFEKMTLWQDMELCVYRLHRTDWENFGPPTQY